MRRYLAVAALVIALALSTACTPRQAADWLNANGRGPVAADSPEARQASRVFTAYWRWRAANPPIPYEANWDRVARCESGGNWSISTGNGYYGGLQFSLSTWRWVGGQGYPHHASKAEQIRRAEILRTQRGGLGHWPVCGRLWY